MKQDKILIIFLLIAIFISTFLGFIIGHEKGYNDARWNYLKECSNKLTEYNKLVAEYIYEVKNIKCKENQTMNECIYNNGYGIKLSGNNTNYIPTIHSFER